MRAPKPKHKGISYSKYGYRFILPFFLVYLVFSLWPLLSTFYYSLFEYTTRNLVETSAFAGLGNYGKVLGLDRGGERPISSVSGKHGPGYGSATLCPRS